MVALIASGDEVTMAFVAVGFVAMALIARVTMALIARASPVAFVAMGKASDVTIYSEAWRLSLGLALRGERRKRWPNRWPGKKRIMSLDYRGGWPPH